MTSKRLVSLAAIAIATATAVALTGCVAGEGSALDSGTATTSEWSGTTLNLDFATYNPLSLLIKEKGWIEDAVGPDVSVTWTQSLGSNKANEAVRADAIDLGSTAGSAALLARANGLPIQTVDVYSQPEWSALVVRGDSDINSVADLRGKTIAATIGTDPYFFLLQALNEAGIGLDEVTVQNLQHADGGAALVNGSVDAWSGLDPMMAASEADAGTKLIYRNVDFNTYGVLNAKESFIADHADFVQLVVDAYEHARAYALANPDELVQILSDVSGVTPEIAQAVLDRTTLDLDPAPGKAQYDVLKVVGPIQVANGDVDNQGLIDDALSSLFNTTFADKADPTRVG